jgi:hypothetical protein
MVDAQNKNGMQAARKQRNGNNNVKCTPPARHFRSVHPPLRKTI